MPEVYPAAYPQPLMLPYNVNVDMGVLRTPMDGGLARQRRLYDVMPHLFELCFIVNHAQLFSWQQWVNQYAYDFFELELVSRISSQAGQRCATHFVRFTTDLAFELIDKGLFRVQVAAELSPAQVSNYDPPAGDTWIIAGGPSAPSPGTVEGGIPDAPSPNSVIAGTPAAPS